MVTDEKGQTAGATATVNIEAPATAAAPSAQGTCTLAFRAGAARVDNASKACLDILAFALRQQRDDRAVLVGEATAKERQTVGANLAAQRVLNAKNYLLSMGGVSASRVEVRTGNADARQVVESFLVPAGADFASEMPGTAAVDESVIGLTAAKPTVAAMEYTTEKVVTTKAIATRGPGGCKAFAVFGYPAAINLGVTDALPQSFRLIVGEFDPQAGITNPEVINGLCAGAGASPNCIPPDDWKRVATGCAPRQAQEFAAGKTQYAYIVWPITSDLPTKVCASLQFPSAWIDAIGTSPTECPSEFGSLFTWRWFAKVTNSSYAGNADNSLAIQLRNAPDANGLLSEQQSVRLTPIQETWYASAWRWFKSGVEEHSGEWVFGTGGISIFALVAWVLKQRQTLKAQAAEAPPQQAPAQPTIIVVTPPAQEAVREDSTAPLRKRPPHRRPPGH